MITNDFDKALILLEKGKAYSNENNKASLLSNLGCYYEKFADQKNALKCIDEAISLEKGSSDTTS
jgi:tetratricopeptide (TPR) repeat protein